MSGLKAVLTIGLVGVFSFFTTAFVGGITSGPPEAPVIITPAEGEETGMTPVFRWNSAGRTTQVEFELAPEGPGTGIGFVSADKRSFAIPPPWDWCCLRPGYVYKWRMRATDSGIPLLATDPYWGPWREGWFRVTGPIDELLQGQ